MIRYKAIVTHLDLHDFLPGEEDTDKYTTRKGFDTFKGTYEFMRIEFIGKAKSSKLSFDYLKSLGQRAFMSPNRYSPEIVAILEEEF